MERKFAITLTGTRRLMMQNGRLANPLDQHAIELAQLTSKKKKTLEDHQNIAYVEAQGSLYETPDDKVGFTNEAIWRCIYDEAKRYKLGETIKQALLFEPTIHALKVGGKTYAPKAFLSLPNATLTRTVVIQGRRCLRTRPITPTADWVLVSDGWTLLDDLIEAKTLTPIIEAAGRLRGIGNWRPRFGTFTAKLKWD